MFCDKDKDRGAWPLPILPGPSTLVSSSAHYSRGEAVAPAALGLRWPLLEPERSKGTSRPRRGTRNPS